MITLGHLKERLAPFTKTKEADKVGVVYFRTGLQVSRFANSSIHQHLSDENQVIYFRVLLDGRMGLASTNSLDEQNLKETFKKALHMARLKLDIRENKVIASFKPLKAFAGVNFEKTVRASSVERAKILRKIFTVGENMKVTFSGNFHNGLTQLAVISPEGEMNYQDYSFAGIKLIAAQGESSAYAGNTDYDIEKLRPEEIAGRAIEKCLLGLRKTGLGLGRYDVILEPAATAELIHWLNYIGFGAKSVAGETSFLCNKAGKRVCGNRVSIYDYGKDKNTFILPFDFEGVSRKKTYLIKNGIAGQPLRDSYYAKLLKTRSSGHANFPDDVDGPLGCNLVMERGTTPESQMIKSAKSAILVTRFHYINGFLDTPRALMTGMTRDGTFLIEEGKIKRALKDMRFTESILEAFSRITHISKERKLIADHLETLGSIYAPSLYIKNFAFTS